MATKELTKGFLTPSTFDDFFKPWNEWFNNGGKWGKVLTMPAVNVAEESDHYLVSLAAPGLSKKDFKINVEGHMLSISSEKEEKNEVKEDKFTKMEYNYSSFSRSFTIPEDVKQDAIEATYEDGVLNIHLPKREAVKKVISNKGITVK